MQLAGRKDSTLLSGFMVAWFLVNCIQASLVGVDGDEAYYWVLSRHLDWGYFDHPPFVTLLMRFGESIAHGTLFTRLGTILLSTFSIWIIFKSLPDDLKNMNWYLLVFGGTVILNVYSFIATPDAPLFFFAALFFFGYKKYLEKDSILHVLLLALSMAGMLYSKYHGVLPIFFTILSNLKLLNKKTFWLALLIAGAAFTPHIVWQWQHNWPTVRFHLFERSSDTYKLEFTTNYILGQILVWGPFTFILFFRNILRVKTHDRYIKAHLFTFYGVLIFFFISSFSSSVEPHWTLVSGVSFITLFVHILLHAKEKYRLVFKKIFYANIALILLARILFAIPQSPFVLIKNYKPFFTGKEWADTIYKKAGETPVIFMNSYIYPSLYSYYHPGILVGGYNEKSYRKTQYSLTERDCELDGKRTLIYNTVIGADSTGIIKTKYKTGALKIIEAFTCTNTLKIIVVNPPKKMKPGQQMNIDILVVNTGSSAITNRNSLAVDYAFFEEKYDYINSPETIHLPDSTFPPGYSKKIGVPVKAPHKKGKFKLLFSIVNPPFKGNFASLFYKVEIE